MTNYSETNSNLTTLSGFSSPLQPKEIPPTVEILLFHSASQFEPYVFLSILGCNSVQNILMSFVNTETGHPV